MKDGICHCGQRLNMHEMAYCTPCDEDPQPAPAPLGVLPVEDDEQRLGWRTV